MKRRPEESSWDYQQRIWDYHQRICDVADKDARWAIRAAVVTIIFQLISLTAFIYGAIVH